MYTILLIRGWLKGGRGGGGSEIAAKDWLKPFSPVKGKSVGVCLVTRDQGT